MSDRKKVIYTTNQAVEAEMIKQRLSNHDIQAFIMNKQDSSYHFGEIEILVNEDSLEEATKIIKGFNEAK